MARKSGPYNFDRRANWMAAYEAELVARRPDLAGKIDWNTATFFYNSGVNFEDAAKRSAEIKNG